MRIPSVFQHKDALRFFSIFILGICFGWFFFLFTYGVIYEQQVERIKRQHEQINDLKKDLSIWREETHQQNHSSEQKIYLQHIHITTDHPETIDTLTIHTIKERVKEQLRPLLKKEVHHIASNKEFIFQAIEKSIITLDEEKYEIQIVHLYLFTTLELHISVQKIS